MTGQPFDKGPGHDELQCDVIHDKLESYLDGQETLIRSLLGQGSKGQSELIELDTKLLRQREDLFRDASENPELILDGLLKYLLEIERALGKLDGDPSLSDEDSNREVSVWAHVLDSIAPLIELIVNSKEVGLHEEWQLTLNEVDRRLTVLELEDPNLKDQRHHFQKELAQIKYEALGRRAEAFLQLPLVSSEGKLDPRELWSRQRSCDNLISDYQVLEGTGYFETNPHVDALNRHITELNQKLIISLEAIPEPEARILLKQWLEEVCDDSEELLTDVEDLPLDLAIEMLVELKEGILFTHQLKPQLQDPELLKRVKKIERQGHNEWVTKSISWKLEHHFGRKAVGLFENLILGLIAFVCILLVIEGVVDLSIQQQYWVIGIETGICLIFLFEFFIKSAYSPDKLNYFKRHAFVDLIPSIPFGFLLLSVGLTPEVMAGLEGGSLVQHSDDIIALKVLRFAKLPRLVRYIKIARPLIRLLRVMIFAFRALDRIVRRQAGVINRNIVLFEPQDHVQEGKKINSLTGSFKASTHLLKEISFRATRGCEESYLKRFLGPRVELAGIRSHSIRELNQGKDFDYDHVKTHQDLRLEDAIESLSNMDVWELRSRYDEKALERLYKMIRLFRRRPLCWLPIFKELGSGGREKEPGLGVVSSCRALGRTLEKWQGRLHWCIDFYGIITPPQLLDKVGQLLVTSASRPAKRLVIFGTAFLLLMGLVELTGIELFERVATKLAKTLGIPIIFLGVVCWSLLLFGKWLKKIASSSSEYYERTGEAQFLGLLTEAKQVHQEDDAEYYYRRCVLPEVEVRALGSPKSTDSVTLDLEKKIAKAFGVDQSRSGDESRQVYLLYRDYQLTPPFHRHSKKTTNQYLGNLTLEGIRRDRLSYSEREWKVEEKLDLENARALWGPHLWFSLITHSIAQRSARLIINYNTHCIPLKEIETYSDSMQERYRNWLADHDDSRGVDHRNREKVSASGFSTQSFSALDFLFADPKREAAIAEEFGQEVVGFLHEDRKNLLRKIFGNYPFHKWPTSQRSINLYQLYWEFIGNGRVFILPFRLIGIGFKLCGWGLGRFTAMIRSVLVSNETFEPLAESPDPYSVAMRKLNRMRKPIAMATMSLRSRFDPEYHGFKIEGCPGESSSINQLREDLDFVGASPEERESFEEQRELMWEGLEVYSKLLKSELWTDLSRGNVYGPETKRALAVAIGINYHSIRDVLDASEILSGWTLEVRESMEGESKTGFQEIIHRVWQSLPRIKKFDGNCFERFIQRHDELIKENSSATDDPGVFKDHLYQNLCKTKNIKLKSVIRALGGEKPFSMEEELLAIMGTARIWSRELVILRAIQSLAQLDMLSEKRLLESVAALEKQG